MATITDPGSINHQNNVHVLEIYINIRSHCVKNADNFNAKFRSVLLKMKDEELQDSDSDLDNSDYGYSYEIPFNQKHFILFNYYAMNGIFLSVYMLLYYLMYKHKPM